MFGSKNRARIAELTYDNRCLGESLDGEITRVRERDNTIGALREEIESLRTTNYALDRTAAKYKKERDELRPDALKHRASRANLKQFQTKANGAAVQAVVS